MSVVPGRRAVAAAFAMMLTALALMTVGAPSQAGPRQLKAPTLTLPDGAEATAGSTLKVVFDAGGDRRITGFRYSLDSPETNRTVAAVTPGGSAAVTVDVGAVAGERQLFAVAVDRRGRVSMLNQVTFKVTATVQFWGTVLSPRWLPVEGAEVTLEPGGLRATTDAEGAFAFTGVTAGEYRATATLGGECPASASQLLFIGTSGMQFQFALLPLNDEPCVPEVEVPPATLGGVVLDHETYQPVEGGATVTLEPGGLQTVTNEFGWYEFPGLGAGTYTVTASAGGACGLAASGTAVLTGYERSLDLILESVIC